MFKLPELPYAYNALEPVMDEATLHFHHDKHHATYTANLNKALESHPELADKSIRYLIAHLNLLPEDIRGAVRNNGGGYFNHALFWDMMAPVAEKIKEDFGSFEEFKKKFSSAAVSQFGSGWAWLVYSDGHLEVLSTANQDNPLTEGKKPLLALDVWEHAYYLQYQNRRPDFVENFFRIINWDYVNKLYEDAVSAKKCGAK